jgi:hypothetical protein
MTSICQHCETRPATYSIGATEASPAHVRCDKCIASASEFATIERLADSESPAEQKAYELGVADAKAAASWTDVSGASNAEIRNLLNMLDAGDPAVFEYLPADPNLSGEWAGDATPSSLAADCLDVVDSDDIDSEVVDAIATAYERGVSDTFAPECERILRAALSH